MAQFLYIKKEGIETLGGPVTREAFVQIYQPKGWQEATSEDVQAHVEMEAFVAQDVRSIDLDTVDSKTLHRVALAHGIDPTNADFTTKAGKTSDDKVKAALLEQAGATVPGVPPVTEGSGS